MLWNLSVLNACECDIVLIKWCRLSGSRGMLVGKYHFGPNINNK